MKVLASPSRIFGKGPARHKMGDELVIDGTIVRALKGPYLLPCYVSIYCPSYTNTEKRTRN